MELTPLLYNVRTLRPVVTLHRNGMMDIIRLVASFGVITLHVKSSTEAANIYNQVFWPLCVPFYYLASLTYFIKGLQDNTEKNLFKRMWQRLIIPFICWTGIYLLLFLIKGILISETHHFVWWRVLFYGESAIQLYFIPTLLCFQVLALSMHLVFSKKKLASGAILFCLSLLYLVIGDYFNCFGVAFSGQYIVIGIYLVIGFYCANSLQTLSGKHPVFLLGCVLIVIAISLNVYNKRLEIGEYPLILPIGGIGAFLLALGFPVMVRIPAFLRTIAAGSFGVYLCHVIFLEGIEFATEKWSGIEYNIVGKTVVCVSIFICSLLLVSIIRRSFIARKLLLGETGLSMRR